MNKIRFDTRQFNKDIKAFHEKAVSSLDSTTKEAAEAIESDTNALDSDIPIISGSTTMSKIENGYQINKGGNLAHPELAAYSEFGTGDFAGALLSAYPQEWKDMAMEYYVNGMGRLPASPALYPSFNKNTVNIADKAAEKIGD